MSCESLQPTLGTLIELNSTRWNTRQRIRHSELQECAQVCELPLLDERNTLKSSCARMTYGSSHPYFYPHNLNFLSHDCFFEVPRIFIYLFVIYLYFLSGKSMQVQNCKYSKLPRMRYDCKCFCAASKLQPLKAASSQPPAEHPPPPVPPRHHLHLLLL